MMRREPAPFSLRQQGLALRKNRKRNWESDLLLQKNLVYPCRPRLRRKAIRGKNSYPEPSSDSDSEEDIPPQCCSKNQCCHLYSVDDVRHFRSVYLRLDDADQFKFFEQRKWPSSINRQKRLSYHLEKPGSRRIANWEEGYLPPPLDRADMVAVCTNYVTWLTGRTRQYWWKPGPSCPEVKGKHLNKPRPSVLGEDAAVWLLRCKEMFLRMPTEGQLTVLPWNAISLTHRAYVLEREADMDDQDAIKLLEDGYVEAPQGSEEDAAPVSTDCYAAATASSLPSREDKHLRYGNALLGLKEDKPCLGHICGLSQFRKIWKTRPELRKVVIRRWIPFAKCDDCYKLRKALSACSLPLRRKELHANLDQHLYMIGGERGVYWLFSKTTSVRIQSGNLSIIIDGADNSDNALPHVCHPTKTTSEAWKARLHLIGAIAHGPDGRPYVFTCGRHVKQGHNVTIQALFDVLVDQKKLRNGKLPPVLHLQLDNTTKQNKGKYLSAFLALLIHYDVFEEIRVNFLPVGHTHEDIDQFFGCLARYFRRHDALSRHDLEDGIQRAYRSADGHRPKVRHWSSVGNVSQWLKDNGVQKIMGVMTQKWRAYRFYKSTSDLSKGEVHMQMRDFMRDDVEGDEWRGVGNCGYFRNFKDGHMPDLLAAIENQTMPNAQRVDVICERAKRQRSISDIANLIPAQFTAKHQADCQALVDQEYSEDPLPFHWAISDARLLFSKPDESSCEEGDSDSDSSASIDNNPNSNLKFTPKLHAVYLFNPSGDDKFQYWLGEANTHTHTHAHIHTHTHTHISIL